MKTLHLVRGLPGSGKSTLAKSMGIEHIETGMFFTREGKYSFDATKVREAHAWCLEYTGKSLSVSNEVVVSNTFTQYWEIEAYFQLAKDMGAEVVLYDCLASYGNTHNVPEVVLTTMRTRWESAAMIVRQWRTKENSLCIWLPTVEKSVNI